MLDWVVDILNDATVRSAIIYLLGGALFFVGKWLYNRAPKQIVDTWWTYIQGPVDTLITQLQQAQKDGKFSDNQIAELALAAIDAAKEQYKRFQGEDAPQSFINAVNQELDDVVDRVKNGEV